MSQNVTTTAKNHSTQKFHFLAGLTTGLITASILQPADLLKTRLQQPHDRTSISLLPTIRAILSGPDANGFRGLWRGTVPSLLRTGLGSALYFSSLNTLRGHWASRQSVLDHGIGINDGRGSRADNGSSSSKLPQLSKTANLVTGAVARAAAGFLLMPVTVVKVRYESSLYNYGSIAGAYRGIMKNEGMKGFFKGAGATAMRDAPYAGLYVVIYEEGKKRFSDVLGRKRRSAGAPEPSMTASKAGAINFSAGVVAAIVATAITNPFDALKTRLQLVPGTYTNLIVASRRMIKEEGWRSLMDGFGLRVARKAASSALAWTVYEELIRQAEVRFTDQV